MTDDQSAMFSSMLWDLRAQVEGQLRCLTKIHRLHEQNNGHNAKATIISELQDFLVKHEILGRASAMTLEQAHVLSDAGTT